MKIGNLLITESQVEEFLNLLNSHIMSAKIPKNNRSKEITALLNKFDLDDGKSANTSIVSFVLADQTGVAIIDDVAETIEIEVLFGADVTTLSPVIVVFENGTVSPASGAQTDFTAPVNYTVTSEDGVNTKTYEVTVTKAAASIEAEIKTFVLAAQTGVAVIDNVAETIEIEVALGTNVATLSPTVSLSVGATVSPASGAQTDFTAPVNYTVTAEDGITTKTYAVTVTVAAA